MNLQTDDLLQICKLKTEFSKLTFCDAFQRIEQLTEQYPIVLREQYRLFCGLCIYKYKRNQFSKPDLPSQISQFQDRLFANYGSLSMQVIRERWSNFGTSSFISSLEQISKGCQEINDLINLLKIPADSLLLIKYLENNSHDLSNSTKLKPQFYSFLPETPITFKNRLITPQEYRNFQ